MDFVASGQIDSPSGQYRKSGWEPNRGNDRADRTGRNRGRAAGESPRRAIPSDPRPARRLAISCSLAGADAATSHPQLGPGSYRWDPARCERRRVTRQATPSASNAPSKSPLRTSSLGAAPASTARPAGSRSVSAPQPASERIRKPRNIVHPPSILRRCHGFDAVEQSTTPGSDDGVRRAMFPAWPCPRCTSADIAYARNSPNAGKTS